MSIYDIDGNPIGGAVDDDSIRRAFLSAIASGVINPGSAIGVTLTYEGLSNAWITNAETAYNAMRSKYTEIANYAIPFFISTDQHGAGVEQHRWANNIDHDGLNFIDINLGDTVNTVYNTETLEAMLARTRQVKNYVGVVGNHDANNTGGQPTAYDLTKYFFSNYDRLVINGDCDSYSFIDGLHNVKCIVSDNYYHSNGNLVNDKLSSGYCDWLINELSKDEYDILFIQHWMIYATTGTYKYRDGTSCSDGIGGSQQLRTLLAARKAKTSGSITDADNVSHSFDFTGCEHNLLCCLHGHQHEEMYAKLDGVLCYVADWFGNGQSCVFGLVDRLNQKLRIWKFNNTQVYEEFVMDL